METGREAGRDKRGERMVMFKEGDQRGLNEVSLVITETAVNT